jgi:hypothetical protein
MMLKNVQLATLMKSDKRVLDKIVISEPEIESTIADERPVFFPYNDTAAGITEKNQKRFIESYFLKEFDMVDASIHTSNPTKEQNFKVQQLNISLRDIFIDQQPGRDLITYNHFKLSIGDFTGSLQQEAVKHISFKDFKISIDSLHVELTLDTLIYRFADFNTGLKALDIQTGDSIHHFNIQSFGLSYRNQSIRLNEVTYESNVSNAVLPTRFKYEHSHFSGTVGELNLAGVNFDSLIYNGQLFIDEINLDKVSVSVFRDKTKPDDQNLFPQYLGESVKAFQPLLRIKK